MFKIFVGNVFLLKDITEKIAFKNNAKIHT